MEALRRDIARKPHKIKRVLTDAGIRGAFLGGVADDEVKAVKAFVNQPSNQSTALKRHPKVSLLFFFRRNSRLHLDSGRRETGAGRAGCTAPGTVK